VTPLQVGDEIRGHRVTRVAASSEAHALYVADGVVIQAIAVDDEAPCDEVGAGLLACQHSALLEVLQSFREGDAFFIVFAAPGGESLGERVARARAREDEMLAWAPVWCDGLAYLHGRQPPETVREFTPEAVWMLEDGPRLLEIGQRARLHRRSRAYKTADPRVDVYGLGALIYFSLTSVMPPSARQRLFDADTGGLALAPLHRLNSDVSVRTEMAVETMLELEPKRRPADVEAARRLLEMGVETNVLPESGITDRIRPEEIPEAVREEMARAREALAASPEPELVPARGVQSPRTQFPGMRGAAPAEVSVLQPASAKVLRGAAPAARRRDRPISYALPAVLLIAVLVSGAAWVVRLLYLAEDEVRVRRVPYVAHARHHRHGYAAHDTKARADVDEPPEPALIGEDNSHLLVVDGGTFRMGDGDAQRLSGPQRSVRLERFYVARTEVTHRQYEVFVRASGYVPEGPWLQYRDEDHLDKPVVGVTWTDALRYCTHYGGRLPTEEEWEKAARGTGTRGWPWGDAPGKALAVTLDADEAGAAPVGSRPGGASPYGAVDMAGNVWEWTADSFAPYPASKATSRLFGRGFKVLRGGAWDFPMEDARVFERMPMSPDLWGADIGFRMVRDPR